VLVVHQSEVATRGGELGLAYDPKAVVPIGATPGADLPSKATIRFDPSPVNNCSPDQVVAAGFTVSWIDSISHKVATPAGRNKLLRICFDLPPGIDQGDSSPLSFVKCLGLSGSPLRNMIMDSTGHYQFVATRDGKVTFPNRPLFRRGDVNEDGRVDTSDVIPNLVCLFLGEGCSACPAEMEVNGDGQLGISDAIYLLIWEFLAGPPPPPPFPDCGPNEMQGPLAACKQPDSCP